VLGEPVIGRVHIRCRPDADAEEIAIDDWQGALDDVRELMA
jgi:hypothetical protein